MTIKEFEELIKSEHEANSYTVKNKTITFGIGITLTHLYDDVYFIKSEISDLEGHFTMDLKNFRVHTMDGQPIERKKQINFFSFPSSIDENTSKKVISKLEEVLKKLAEEMDQDDFYDKIVHGAKNVTLGPKHNLEFERIDKEVDGDYATIYKHKELGCYVRWDGWWASYEGVHIGQKDLSVCQKQSYTAYKYPKIKGS